MMGGINAQVPCWEVDTDSDYRNRRYCVGHRNRTRWI